MELKSLLRMAGAHFLPSFFSAQKPGHFSDGCFAPASAGLGASGLVIGKWPHHGPEAQTFPRTHFLWVRVDGLMSWANPDASVCGEVSVGKHPGPKHRPGNQGTNSARGPVSSTVACTVSVSLQMTDAGPPWTPNLNQC